MITNQVTVFEIFCGCHVVPTTKNELNIVACWQMGNWPRCPGELAPSGGGGLSGRVKHLGILLGQRMNGVQGTALGLSPGHETVSHL